MIKKSRDVRSGEYIDCRTCEILCFARNCCTICDSWAGSLSAFYNEMQPSNASKVYSYAPCLLFVLVKPTMMHNSLMIEKNLSCFFWVWECLGLPLWLHLSFLVIPNNPRVVTSYWLLWKSFRHFPLIKFGINLAENRLIHNVFARTSAINEKNITFLALRGFIN